MINNDDNIEWFYTVQDTTYIFPETNSDLMVFVGKVWADNGFEQTSKEFGSFDEAQMWCSKIFNQQNAVG